MKNKAEKREIEKLLHATTYRVCVEGNTYKIGHEHTRGGYIKFIVNFDACNLELASVSRDKILRAARVKPMDAEQFYSDLSSKYNFVNKIKSKLHKTPETKGDSKMGTYYVDLATGKTTKDAEFEQEQQPTAGTKASPKTVEGGTGDLFLDKIVAEVAKHVKVEPTEEVIEQVVTATLSRAVNRVEVKKYDGKVKDLGLTHRLTEKLINLVALKNVMPVNIMLVGAAGGGKTTTCEKVADGLDLSFYPVSVGPQTSKSDLLGYCNANGGYVSSRIREAFENGGLLLLDEVDAAHAGVLTIINALLENGYCSFPDKVVKKHENFVCICACNTYGRGADRQYVGRNQLDAATLDRFLVIDFDYDEMLEQALCGNDDWFKRVKRYRMKAEDLKARVIISPRASIKGARLLEAGFNTHEVEDMVIWKGIDNELKNKIRNN